MRFSPRSKLSIILSLVAIIAIVGGFALTGIIRGSAGQAHAAGGSHLPMTLTPLKYHGVASFKTQRAGLIPSAGS